MQIFLYIKIKPSIDSSIKIKSRIEPVNKIKSRNGPSIKIKPRNDFRNKIKRLETVNYLYIEGNWKQTKLLLQIFLYGPSIKIKPSIDSSIKIIDPVNKIKFRNGPVSRSSSGTIPG